MTPPSQRSRAKLKQEKAGSQNRKRSVVTLSRVSRSALFLSELSFFLICYDLIFGFLTTRQDDFILLSKSKFTDEIVSLFTINMTDYLLTL